MVGSQTITDLTPMVPVEGIEPPLPGSEPGLLPLQITPEWEDGRQLSPLRQAIVWWPNRIVARVTGDRS